VGSIVVLSPHSDDGVLSLGASMARWVRAGHRVELLVVLALDPASTAESGGWDRRGGFRSEGEAALGRREEDRRACATLGVAPRWLSFGSVDYDRHGDDHEIGDAIRAAVAASDLVFVPGAPLTHPDHAWLSRLALERLSSHSIARYAEQPYATRARTSPFERADVAVRDRLAKWRALRAYHSQLPLLGMRGLGGGPFRFALRDERYELPEGRIGSPL
jgi:LmbE family N-acetylglucosaminyl deacetylase